MRLSDINLQKLKDLLKSEEFLRQNENTTKPALHQNSELEIIEIDKVVIDDNNENREVVLILTVGTSLDPLEFSLRETCKNADKVRVLAFYGKTFSEQERSPLQVVAELQAIAKDEGCVFEEVQLSNPNSIDSCFEEIAETLKKFNISADEIIFDVTGGTKAMVAALSAIAITFELDIPAKFVYIGGAKRDVVGRVTGEMIYSSATNIFYRLTEQKVLDDLKELNFEKASIRAEMLSGFGRFHYLKDATQAFYLWDSFQYIMSNEILRRLKRLNPIMLESKDYRSLAENIDSLLKVSEKISDLSKKLRAKEKDISFIYDYPENQHAYGLIIADCYQNALRRKERMPVEAVMRSYRAIELAVKLNLIKHKIDPDKPDWTAINSISQNKKYDEDIRFIMLDLGVNILCDVLNYPLSSEARQNIKTVQEARNRCYLEHGFNEISKEKANDVLEITGQVLEELFDEQNFDELHKQLEIKF